MSPADRSSLSGRPLDPETLVIDNAGPDALIIRFGDVIDPELVPLIRAATDRLNAGLSDRLRAAVPSYTTLMLHYDPTRTDFERLCARVRSLLQGLTLDEETEGGGRCVEIPVWYHPEVGPDLERVARYHQIDVEEVIRRHSEREYRVFAIGFAPGFAYLGEVPEGLRTPRLDTPRQGVPVGSVALADRQTAVYPIATPGGWNLLGRTALAMFDPERDGLCPVAPGDRVRFVPIGRREFLAQGGCDQW